MSNTRQKKRSPKVTKKAAKKPAGKASKRTTSPSSTRARRSTAGTAGKKTPGKKAPGKKTPTKVPNKKTSRAKSPTSAPKAQTREVADTPSVAVLVLPDKSRSTMSGEALAKAAIASSSMTDDERRQQTLRLFELVNEIRDFELDDRGPHVREAEALWREGKLEPHRFCEILPLMESDDRLDFEAGMRVVGWDPETRVVVWQSPDGLRILDGRHGSAIAHKLWRLSEEPMHVPLFAEFGGQRDRGAGVRAPAEPVSPTPDAPGQGRRRGALPAR
ncbi:MAG: hypothetical protein HC927_02485, partial [Deltaproteobacteria bacterium]|nr:hypothetical protein [Deltaproteobacteria bacterium]